MANGNGLTSSLAELRSRIDTSPYTPVRSAPTWLVEMSRAAMSDGGVLALLGPSGINVSTRGGGRDRAIPDTAAVMLSGLAGSLKNTGKCAAIGVPPSARHLPLLIASSMVLGDAVSANVQLGMKSRGVLVVSPDLDIRSRYCDLYVSDVLLDKAYPGLRMRPDGTFMALRPESSSESNRGVCFFLPNLELPKRPQFRASIVILDLRYGRWIRRVASLATWAHKVYPLAGVVALYTLGDAESATALLQANYTDLPVDHTAVATCQFRTAKEIRRQQALSVNWWMSGAPAFLDRSHEIVEVPGCTDIDDSVKGIARFLKDEANTQSPTLNRAHWLLAVLNQLPVPVPWYESAALESGRAPLQRLISNLGSETRFYAASLGPVVQTLRAQLNELCQVREAALRPPPSLKNRT